MTVCLKHLQTVISTYEAPIVCLSAEITAFEHVEETDPHTVQSITLMATETTRFNYRFSSCSENIFTCNSVLQNYIWASEVSQMVRNYYLSRSGCHHRAFLFSIMLFLDVGNNLLSFARPQRFALLWSFGKHFPEGKKVYGTS